MRPTVRFSAIQPPASSFCGGLVLLCPCASLRSEWFYWERHMVFTSAVSWSWVSADTFAFDGPAPSTVQRWRSYGLIRFRLYCFLCPIRANQFDAIRETRFPLCAIKITTHCLWILVSIKWSWGAAAKSGKCPASHWVDVSVPYEIHGKSRLLWMKAFTACWPFNPVNWAFKASFRIFSLSFCFCSLPCRRFFLLLFPLFHAFLLLRRSSAISLFHTLESTTTD